MLLCYAKLTINQQAYYLSRLEFYLNHLLYGLRSQLSQKLLFVPANEKRYYFIYCGRRFATVTQFLALS